MWSNIFEQFIEKLLVHAVVILKVSDISRNKFKWVYFPCVLYHSIQSLRFTLLLRLSANKIAKHTFLMQALMRAPLMIALSMTACATLT
jgi:hypothetical protein